MLTLNRIQSRSGKQIVFFLMCLLVSFAGIMPVRSQEKTKMVTVEGTVVDETETPVIGANVYIKGSTKGVSTNVDGNFIFTGVPVGQTVTVSFIGYKDYQVRVTKGGEKLRISLEPDAKMLEEVVVVPYGGPVARKDLTGPLFLSTLRI